MMVRAGALDRRVTVLERRETRNQDNVPTLAWVEVGHLYAARWELSSKEVTGQAGKISVGDAKFLCRWTKGIKPTMRLRSGDVLYSITGLQEVGRRTGLWIFVSVVDE